MISSRSEDGSELQAAGVSSSAVAESPGEEGDEYEGDSNVPSGACLSVFR